MHYPNNDAFTRFMPPEAVKIFVSYAHEDQAFRNVLGTHLASLVRIGLVTPWYDAHIRAGIEWAEEISRHLNTADIILLLISPAFMASDFCYHVEMTQALERHHSGDARVIPIIVRPTYWELTPIGKLQALPRGGKAINAWRNRDQAYRYVVQDLFDEIKLLHSQRWLEKSGISQEIGRYDQALEACDASIALNPANIPAYESKGALLWKLERYREALHVYEEIIRLDPKHIVAHMHRAYALWVLGRHEEALIACKHVISLDPENSLAFLIMGGLYELLRDQSHRRAKQIDAARARLYLTSKYAIINPDILPIRQANG